MKVLQLMNKKTILITGTSFGIGKFLAESFLKLNYNVIGISRNNKINHKNYIHLKCDLKNKESIENLVKNYNHETYFFIHNAGIHGPIGKFSKLDFVEWTNAFQVNLFSGVYLLQNLIDNIIKNKGGCIFIAGGGSANAMANFTSYSCSKTALVRFIENISEEYASLRAHCISPGPNKTKLLDEAKNNGVNVDEKRIVSTDLVFDLCNYLISNNCPNLSGRQIHVKDDYKKLNNLNLSQNVYKLRRLINE